MRVENQAGPLAQGNGGWCSSCRLAWTESKAAHCAGCCRQFSSDSAFDIHHTTERGTGLTVCHDPATLRTRAGKPKLVERAGVWGAPGPEGGWPRGSEGPTEGPAGEIGPPLHPQRALFLSEGSPA